MEPLNQSLFLLINASHQPSIALLGLTKCLAEVPLYFVLLCLVILWLKDSLSKKVVLNTCYVTSFALCVNVIIAHLWPHNRPFMDHVGMNFIRHAPDSSFPSDHITFLASTAFCLYWDKHYRLLGAVLLVLSLTTAWARVFSGVHYPLDILAAYVLSAFWSVLFFLFCASKLESFNDWLVRRFRACSKRIFHFH